MVLDKDRVRENIEKRISEDLAAGRIGGALVLVKQRGEVIYQNCFGKAAEGRELTYDTIFRLASMTKPITAVAIMKQIERGLVSLDDTLDKFIPEYADMEIGRIVDGKIQIVGKAQNKIKIMHLLTHTSGVGTGVLGEVLGADFSPDNEYDLQSVAAEYASKPITFEPFSAQLYSPLKAFDLLALVVEITSGMTFDKFLKKEIFEPLGMVDTTFVPSDEQWERMTLMHSVQDGEAIFLPLDREHIFLKLPLTYFCGGAGLVSTISDYERFADMLLAGGVGADGVRILSEESVKRLQAPSVPAELRRSPFDIWGLGVRVVNIHDYHLPCGAYGWSGAFGTHFWIDPENEIVGIYMKNSHYDGGSEARTSRNFEIDVYK
ncbi:MAG: beta-lactamase family protein [Clostridia bacterium]|nr:beta-lactamase family protein [Clostridia bacterium]